MIANPFSVLLSPVHELQELQEQELHVGEEVNAVNVPKQRVQINQIQYDEFQFRPFQLQEQEFKQEIRQEESEIMNRRIYSSSFECGMNNKNCLENYPITYKLRSHSNDHISSSYQQRKQCQDLYQEVMRYTISNHHKKKRTNSNPGEQVEMDEIDIEEEDEEEDENEEFMRFDEENGEDSFDNSTTHSSISSSSENSTSTISPTQSVSHQSNSTLSKKKNKNNDSTNDKNNDSTNDKNNNNDNSNNNTYNNNNNNKFQQHHNNNRLRFDSSGKIEYKTFSLDDRYLILPKKKKKLYKRLSLPLCHADLPSDSLALSHSSESLSASSSDASMHLLSLAPEDSFLQEGCNPQTKNDANKEAQSNNNNKQDKGEHGLINNTEIDFIQSDNLKNLKMLWKKGFISDTEFCVRKHQLTEATQSAENERGLSRHEIARRITSPIRNHLPPDFSQFKPIKALKHTFDSTTRKWSSQAITVKIDREPFGKGGLRMVYHLQDLSFINQNPNSDATFVAKTAIDQSEDPATYFRDVEMQALASSYAQLYNSYNPPRRVQFLPAWILQLPIDSTYISQASLRNTYVDTTHENRSGVLENFSYGCLDKTRRRKYMFFGVEPYIKGEYHKHNNNYGYVSDLDRNTPQAFSHFTFEASNNEILVVDIQGVMDHYTDPQIHTRSGREFGKGNLSVRGFRRFFESHRCNAICRYLKLPLVNPERTNESKGTLPAQTYMKKQQIDHVSMELRHYYDQSVAFKKHATRNLNQMEMTSYTYNPKCSMCGIDSVCTVQ